MTDTARELGSRRVKENIEARRCIKSKYLILERELQETKWFAYRFMSPFQATRRFALAYDEHYKRSFARHFDRNAKVSPVNWAEFGKPCRSMTHLWVGRQSADRLGMPYDDYLEFFDDFNMRRTRKHLPRPNQIEGGTSAKTVWPARLAAFQNERAWHQLVRLEMPQLHIDNYRGLAAQAAFRVWAMDVAAKPGRTFKQAMEQLSFRKRVLPSEAFLALIEEDMHKDFVQRLEEDCRHGHIVVEQSAQLSTASYWPSCFGLIEPPNTSVEPCGSCTFKVDCRKVLDFVARASTSNLTTPDADEVKRKKDRERQARHRKKKKEAAVSF